MESENDFAASVKVLLQNELKEVREKDDVDSLFSALRLIHKLKQLEVPEGLKQHEYKKLFSALEWVRSNDYEGFVIQGHMVLRLILAIKLAAVSEVEVRESDMVLAGLAARQYLAGEEYDKLAWLKYVCERLKVRFPISLDKKQETILNHELNKVKQTGEF